MVITDSNSVTPSAITQLCKRFFTGFFKEIFYVACMKGKYNTSESFLSLFLQGCWRSICAIYNMKAGKFPVYLYLQIEINRATRIEKKILK